MPAVSALSRSRSSALIAVLGALSALVGPSPARALTTAPFARPSMQMPMGASTPEHVAEALADLREGHVAAARVDLRRAIRAQTEPMQARMHAKEALKALGSSDRAMAQMHAANGAAVEHLTYAMDALSMGHPDMALSHLREARSLPRVHKYAKAAIAAIRRHESTAARQQIKAGLRAANHE